MTATQTGRQAITTKYHGATDTMGSRISARCDAGKVFVPYNYALSASDNHAKAAEALMTKLGWNGDLIGGGTRDGYAFVFLPTTTTA